MFDTAIIGGGAAGLAAAIFSARREKNVLLLERLPRVGKKILSTGNGRCNITNKNIDISRYHGTDASFAEKALTAFPLSETISFFESMGLLLTEGENGKLYPKSLQASSVLDLMRIELSCLGISETVDAFVTSIEKNKDGFSIATEDERTFSAKTVIMATGGKAAPSMGTDGQGYSLVQKFGHTVVTPLPSLVQIKTEPPMRALKGVKHIGKVSLFVDGALIHIEKGEILFTDYGLSGPPVFNLSRYASEAVRQNKKVRAVINFFPDYTPEALFSLLEERKKALPHLDGEAFLIGLMPKLLGREITKRARDFYDLSGLLSAFPLKVTGVMPWANAQVTAGGIATRDVDPLTMESRLCPGIYFCGEILDIDGDCGGFNLQWAWSSAFLAAQNI